MSGLFPTRYGHFSADGREYVITRPDTPRPWVNVICPGRYGTVISQVGSGYSWLDHASFNRLTRWEQDLVRDAWGRYLYVRDRDSGRVWSLTWQPVQAKGARYVCRHGIGYTTFESSCDEIEARLTVFVPPDDTLEIWRIELRNTSRRKRRLDVFSYFEWNLGPSPDTHREFHRLFIETEYVASAGALLATKRLNTIAEHGVGQPWNTEWPHVAFHASSVRPRGHESDKERFLGRHGSVARPHAVVEGSLSGTTGKWQDGIGALHVALDLPGGAAREMALTLGLADTRAEALRLARRYRDPAAVERAWTRMRRHWDRLLGALEVTTPDPAFDTLTNTWLKYQAISSRLRGRTGYFQPGGAYGFRDQLQDSLVFLPLAPEHTRAQILLHAAHQFADGTAWHWWHPLTEEGLKKPLNDDLLWLPFVVCHYQRETGDFATLDERVAFLGADGRPSRERATLYEHCRRAIDSFWTRLSPHGVPRMGAGDWNDGLSAIGRELKAESVWLAQFLIGVLDEWVELERRRAKPDRAVMRHYAREAEKMRRAVNRHFWDGAWYVRATKDDGTPIGSRKNRDGRIYINAQTWAILSRVVPARRLPALLGSMEKHIYKKYGPVALAPAYRTPDASIGYLTRYAPGTRENGGLYTHAAVWAVQAECALGRTEQAWQLYRAFSPILRGRDPEHYAVEPYVTPGNVDGPDSPHFGRGGWTWYTGSAAWLFRISTEWLLGVRPEWDGLRVQPCLPAGWNGFRMRRRFRGATYRIDVKRGDRDEVRVDGDCHDGTLLPVFGDGRVHRVEVTLARASAATPAARAASSRRARPKASARR
ncbi:MAG TPA: glycosyl hydrolase family 65 protein [Candidatus Saccharimonadaceae bacterium]|jgi:cellobiose phosphorylase|nr:glycosyl hydrolase family 65 protein [Candidatus Saccharimonadaceae bacterium]